MQIQINWLLRKPTDQDLHCLQRQGISGFNMTRVNSFHTSADFCCLLITFANSLDPDQANVVFLKDSLKKLTLKKSTKDKKKKMQKLPRMQRVKEYRNNPKYWDR